MRQLRLGGGATEVAAQQAVHLAIDSRAGRRTAAAGLRDIDPVDQAGPVVAGHRKMMYSF